MIFGFFGIEWILWSSYYVMARLKFGFFSIEWILWSSYYVMASLIELSKDKINSDVSFILNMAIPQSYIHRDRYILGK